MITATVHFYGTDTGGYGLPEHFYSCYITSVPRETDDSGVATARILSGGSPEPNPPHKLVTKGGPEKAISEMLDILRTHPDIKGLKERISLQKNT